MSDVSPQLAAALGDRYRIERELGQGGMATVYLALDLRHERRVAIKVMRPELAAVIGAERFLQEIKVTANLQHPHILGLMDSGHLEGTVFYVMPYVEGESLRERLDRERQLPVEEAVRLTVQVAGALDYAHRHGVIHRDIKPENILLHDGQALVADFGIALAVNAAGSGRMTETGMSLGTPAYMSPEQAMGERSLDARTDVYALGCVLYEMLVGEPPFTGPTAQAVLAKVITEKAPSATTLRESVPRHVTLATQVALAKLPADRFPTAAEFAEALVRPGALDSRFATAAAEAVVGVELRPRWFREPRVVGLAAVATVAAAAALWSFLRPRPAPAPPPLERFVLTFERGRRLADQAGTPIALSPDGSRIVYHGIDSLGVEWLFSRDLDRVQPVPIVGSRQATQPFFSPDGRWLGFFQDGRIRKVASIGGAVVSVSELPGGGFLQGASWSGGGGEGPSDIIVFSTRGRLYRVRAAGGTPTLVIAPDSARGDAFRWPEMLPDGRHVMFTVVRQGVPKLAVLSLDHPAVTLLGQDGMNPRWVEAGFVVFTQVDNTLFAAPFDPRRLRFTGPPEPLAEAVLFGGAYVGKLGVARRTGALAYLSGSIVSNDLVLVDRSGRQEALPAPADRYFTPRFSPDGSRIAVTILNMVTAIFGSGDLWVYDLRSKNRTRVTFDSVSSSANWAPGGRYLAYSSLHGGRKTDAVYRIAVDGSGTPESLLVRPAPVNEAMFTPDGRRLVFREGVSGRARDIWVVPVDSSAGARPLLRTPFNERMIALSPDGHWLAYVSNEAGTDEVYVRTLEEGSPRWRVSTGGGTEPRWGPGARELFFRHADSVYVTRVEPGTEFRNGRARALFGGRFQTNPNLTTWDVSPDGSRFVFVRTSTGEEAQAVHLLLHWFERRLAVGEKP